MFINHTSHYIPSSVLPNAYFTKLNGVTDDWMVSRTGIHERRVVSKDENTNTLAISALKNGIENLPYPKEEIDLIVGATYTPYDSIVTLAHAAQNFLQVDDIPVVSISSACSSFLNAVEIVEGYFALNKASKALVLLSDNNTAYRDESDLKSGHLWGDAAAAVFISKEQVTENDIKIEDIVTAGAATVGKAMDGVMLRFNEGGILMPNGRDVFINACQYMTNGTLNILKKNGYTIDDLNYLIPHQANLRIAKRVIQNLGIDLCKAISNIERLGNTGCAGAAIGLSENKEKFKKGDKTIITVFGGGYSYGAMLLEH